MWFDRARKQLNIFYNNYVLVDTKNCGHSVYVYGEHICIHYVENISAAVGRPLSVRMFSNICVRQCIWHRFYDADSAGDERQKFRYSNRIEYKRNTNEAMIELIT